MALRCTKLLRTIKSININRYNVFSTAGKLPEVKVNELKEFRTENNLVYYEDPDKFGNLSQKVNIDKVLLDDEGDIKEEKYITDLPLPSQKLTTRQYADLIKQYLSHKRLKEAIDVLEVRMLQEDRVKPENYIYNILIGACADVGYTKKAFKLFNDMKRRALKPTGDTYTCLFHACSNSPWPANSLKLATHLRELMVEKGVEPNITNYNSMIKAFGRCGDLTTAFKIVDEMVARKIKIRVHTFNHLLQACISDKENGLRHALIVWRKMLNMREKPNIYSFNLMLKCVKDCNLGSETDIKDLIGSLQEQVLLEEKKKTLQIVGSPSLIGVTDSNRKEKNLNEWPIYNENKIIKHASKSATDILSSEHTDTSTNSHESNEISTIKNSNISMQVVKLPAKPKQERTVPNLLSKVLQMQHVLALREVKTLQDKFAVVGGQEDFLKEMEVYSVKPDVKTFTQMLPLIQETVEAENQLLSLMKDLDIRSDIDFYNMLIKKRCLRSDYESAFEVMKIIKKEGKIRKKRFPDRKKLHLKPNIMTYGVLAMACRTKENARTLLSEMDEAKMKVNIEILGTLMRHGTVQFDFGYVLYIMNMVKDLNLKPNPVFIKHLEIFHDKCTKLVYISFYFFGSYLISSQSAAKGPVFLIRYGGIRRAGDFSLPAFIASAHGATDLVAVILYILNLDGVKAASKNGTEVFKQAFRIFSMGYKNWLKDFDIDEIMAPEHPWAQFNESYPETVQRPNFKIKEPRKFYKRTRKYIKYKPTV